MYDTYLEALDSDDEWKGSEGAYKALEQVSSRKRGSACGLRLVLCFASLMETTHSSSIFLCLGLTIGFASLMETTQSSTSHREAPN